MEPRKPPKRRGKDPTALGVRMSEAEARLGLNATEMAARMNTKRGGVHAQGRWSALKSRDPSTMTLSTIMEIAKAAERSVSYMLFGVDAEQPPDPARDAALAAFLAQVQPSIKAERSDDIRILESLRFYRRAPRQQLYQHLWLHLQDLPKR